MKIFQILISSVALLFVFTLASCSKSDDKIKTQAIGFSKAVSVAHFTKISNGNKSPYQTLDALLASNPHLKLPAGCTVISYDPNATGDEGVLLRLQCGSSVVRLLANGAAIVEK